MEGLLFFVFYAVIVVACVRISGRKGYSRVLFGVGCVILGPLMLVIAALLPNKRRMEAEAEARAEARYRAATAARPVSKPAPQKPQPEVKKNPQPAPRPEVKEDSKAEPVKAPASKTAEELNEEGMACYERDPARALRLFEQAAEMGNVSAQYNAGTMYYDGKGCDEDFVKALKWFEKSAEQGYAEAQFMCAETLREIAAFYRRHQVWNRVDDCHDAMFEWYEKAAEQGHAEAQNMCGRKYFMKNEHAKARYWFEKAKAQGEDVEVFLREIEKKLEAAAGNASE